MSMRVGGSEAINRLDVELDVSELDFKNTNNQAQRFGNSALKNHPQLGSVQQALKVLQPEQLIEVLKKTGNALNGQGSTVNVNKEEMPKLASPQSFMTESTLVVTSRSSSSAAQSASAQMTALLAQITQLTTESTLQNLQGKLQGYNAMMGGAVTSFTAMAKQIEEQATAWAQAKDDLAAAQKQANEYEHDVNDAESKLLVAESKLDAAETNLKKAQDKLHALEAATEQKPGIDGVIDLIVNGARNSGSDVSQAKQEVAAAQQKVNSAKSDVKAAESKVKETKATYTDYVKTTLDPAIKAEADAKEALKNSQATTLIMVGSVTKQQMVVIETKRKENDAESKSLTFLMALMAQLINDSSSEDLKATAELKAKLSAAAAKDAEKKAQEYEEQVRQAEEMQKTMGCIGKVLGWLITAVSFVAAAFTGGASLALAAVGLALALGDEISQAVSGVSFMSEAMQPLMDAIVKPLMEALGQMFSDILEGLGVDKDTAKLVGQVMGAIAAAAVLMAGVFVAGSVLSKVAGVVMKKIGTDVAEEASKNVAKNVATEIGKEVAGDVAKNAASAVATDLAEEVGKEVTKKALQATMKKLINSAFGQAVKRISQGFGRAMGTSEAKMGQISNRIQMANTGAQFVNSSIQVAGSIVVADMIVEASKARAQMLKDSAIQELLNEMMERAVETFTHRTEAVNSIIKNISVVAENQMQAGKYITRQMAAVAG